MTQAAPIRAPIRPSLCGAALAAVAAFVLGHSRVRAAEGTVALVDRCLADARAAFVSSGATPDGQTARGFLTEGEAATHPMTLSQEECVGFLALGRGEAADIGLALFTDTGIELTADRRNERHAYVRYCGAANLALVAVVRLIDGNGEYRLLTIHGAPAQPPDLDRTVGECFATSVGVTEPLADVGPAPGAETATATGNATATATAEVALDLRSAELARIGYRRLGQPFGGTLAPRTTATHEFPLTAGRCYAILATGGDSVDDLDVLVRGPQGSMAARDVAQARDATVEFCPEESGAFAAEVRMYQGEGDYRVAALELAEPEGVPPGITGGARPLFAKLGAQARSHGLPLRRLGWSYLTPGALLGWPVTMSSGRCYAFAALPADEAHDADVDVRLVDDQGRMLGWDLGTASSALLYHCAQRTGTFRLLVSIYGRPGRVLALEAQE